MKKPKLSCYVTYEPQDQMVHVELQDGKIDLSIYLSNETCSSPEMAAAIDAWAKDSQAVIIAPRFTLASPVDCLIESHQLLRCRDIIDLEARPIFEAVKAELEAQIKRIDALVFGD